MDKSCLFCGSSLANKRAGAMYCSREHKARAGARRQRAKMTPEDRKRAYAARPKPARKVSPYGWTEGDTHKRCTRCDEEKPVNDFYWISTRKSPSSFCRPCLKQYEAARRRQARGLPEDAVLPRRKSAPVGHSYLHRGYRLVKQPDHHRADKSGYVFEHILVAEQKYGIQITRDFTVHHRNALRGDNRPENLELRVGIHGKGGDYLDAILADPNAREAAAVILRGYGWSVELPDQQGQHR